MYKGTLDTDFLIPALEKTYKISSDFKKLLYFLKKQLKAAMKPHNSIDTNAHMQALHMGRKSPIKLPLQYLLFLHY